MPLIDDPTLPSLLVPRGFIPLPGSDETTRPVDPNPPQEDDKGTSFWENLAPTPGDKLSILAAGALNPFLAIPQAIFSNPTGQAALRQSNTLSSAIANFQDTYGVSNDLIDPNYSPWEDVAGTPYESYWKSTFVYSNNPKYTEALKRSIDRQEEDRRTVASGGALGTVAGILAGAVDPTILIPVGGEITLAGKGVWTIGKGALAGARAGGVGTGLYELALHGSQETRTFEESVVNISTGVVLGAVLGGTIASALSRTQTVGAEAALEKLATINVPGSAGAAAPHYFTLDDLTINGTITRNIAASTAYSPNLRGNFRESPLARRTYQEIATNTLQQQMHQGGLSLGPSVETNIKVSLGETIGQALGKHPDFYLSGKKAGFGMSSDQFDEAIGRAMRRNDVGDNEFVTSAAKMWRGQVIEPLTKQAIDLGMLPEDVGITEAPSYFSRMYNTDKMIAQKPQFMAITTDHFNGILQEQYQKAVQALTTRQADLAEELTNLRLSPEDRIKKLEGLEAQREELELAFEREADIADQVRGLRAEARKAKEEGNVEAQAAAEQKISSLKEAGGEEFQTFKKEEAKLKKTARQINLGYAGMQEKADAIFEKLTDLSHGNFKSLQRLVKRGQTLAKQLKKLDPEKTQQLISDLRSDFYALITRSERAQDSLAKQIEKLRADETKKIESALAEAGLNKEKLNKTEQKKAAKIEKDVRAANTAITDRLTRGLELERARTTRLSAISDRLQAAEAIDNTIDIAELKNSVDELTLEISNKALGRGERAVELQARLAKLDPKKIDEHIANLEQLRKDIDYKFREKWEMKRLGEGVDLSAEVPPDFSRHAKDMAQEVYDSITGNDYGSASVDPQFHLAATSGPLKDRTFHIPDEKIEDFLEDNVVKVMERFSRTMAAQIELARKFPGDPLLQKRFQDISREYDELTNAATTEAERLKLDKDRKGVFRDLRALIEIHRGSYLAKENASSYGRVVRGTMLFNYMRSMGGAAFPSISDLYNPAIFHGIGTIMDAGVPALMKAVSKQGALIKEAHLAGVAERLGHYRLLTLTEIGDPYAQGTAIERLLENGSKIASKWNGLNMLTDFEKDFDAVLTQFRMNKALLAGAKAKQKDIVWMAQSGLGPEMRERIAGYIAKHGTEEDGITVANTELWDDFEATRAYRGAISFNVNADIVTRGVGDVPLFAYTPTGKAFLQFKTFSLAAHQRTFLRSMQLGPAQFMSGLIGLTTIGMFVTYLKALRGGAENYERFLKSTENPGYLVAEGLDATGLFTIPIELSNVAEKASLRAGYPVNPIKTPIMLAGRAFVPDTQVAPNSQRFASQGFTTSLAGPTIGLLEDIPVAAGAGIDLVAGEEVSPSQRNAANRIIPYQSYIGMRELIQVLENNSPYVDNE